MRLRHHQAVLFQPVLMGRPREAVAGGGGSGVEPPPRPVEFTPAVQSAAASIRQAPTAAAPRTNGNGASPISGKPDDRVAAEPKAAVPPRQRGNGSSGAVSHENGAAMALDSGESKDDFHQETGAARRKKSTPTRRAKAAPTRKQ